MRRQTIVWIIAALTAGCSSVPPRIEPVTAAHQSVSYDRGQLKVASDKEHQIGLTLVDHTDDTVIIGVSVSNTGDEPFEFSESNVTGELISGEETLPVEVNSYQSVMRDLDVQGYEAAKQAGWTSMSVGSIFVPFGGIAVSAARLLLSLGQIGTASTENEIDSKTLSQLPQVYLRRHTLAPGTSYEGLLRIGLPDEFEVGDTLVFEVSAEHEIQRFNFQLRPRKS